MYRQEIRKTLAVVLLATALLLSYVAILPKAQAQPPSSDIQDAISRGRQWLSSLIHYLPNNRAVMSEYHGAPLVVLRGDGTKYVAGWGATHLCSTVSISQYSEQFIYKFPSCSDNQVTIVVTLTWTSGSYSTSIRFDVTNNVAWSWYIYFGNTLRCSVEAYQLKACSFTLTWQEADFASNRHTVRHGSQIYYEITSSSTVKTYLANFMADKGFHVNWDIYKPIWRNVGLKNDYVYDISHSDGDPDVYHDCHVSYGIEGFRSYEYQSKVCLAPSTYVDVSAGDSLVPTLQAIHVLRKTGSPTASFSKPSGLTCSISLSYCPFAGTTSLTPLSVARTLRDSAWNGYGIKHPSDTSIASGVRTAAAITLWTLLRYYYGYTEFDPVLHSAVSAVLDARVKGDGVVRTSDGFTYYRPNLIGAFYIGWNQYKYRAPTSIADWFNMPEEYTGVRVSNVETTGSMVGALEFYLRARGG